MLAAFRPSAIRYPLSAIRRPMRLLALDTSTEACSVALLLDGHVRMRSQLTERGHAELVLPMVESLLGEAGISLADLDGLAFGRGPGAFTGLRIAAGVVQGLALGASLPVVPVSSLASVAEQVQAPLGDPVLVCNDARMGEVYWGVFRREAGGTVTALCSETVSTPDMVGEGGPPARHAAGNALARYPALADRLRANGLQFHDGVYPRADSVARLGAIGLAEGRGVPAEQALPVYVRDDVARPSGAAVTGLS
jgi:tRNA threonylcarbamoyladenosine biosynthesis protein TsaB